MGMGMGYLSIDSLTIARTRHALSLYTLQAGTPETALLAGLATCGLRPVACGRLTTPLDTPCQTALIKHA
jgi:hypothetical protein